MRSQRIINILILIFMLGAPWCVSLTPAESDLVRESIKLQDTATPFWAQGVGDINVRFELAKRSTPELIVFLRRMPKGGDLHNHVSGAVYSDYILESAKQKKLNYNLTSNMFTKDNLQEGMIISIDDLISTSKYLAQYLDNFSMRGWNPNRDDGHDHFFRIFSRISSADLTTEGELVEIIERNIYENVQYLELMTSCVPDDVSKTFNSAGANIKFEKKDLESDEAFEKELQLAYSALEPHIGCTAVAGAIKQNLDARENYIKDRVKGFNDGIILVRYMPQLHRTQELEKFFINAVVSIVAIKADERVVGLNIVDPEDDPRSLENFTKQMAILDFLWKKMSDPNRPLQFSLHAGELVLKNSPVEPMQNRISESIEKGHARRIGHGVCIAWERNAVKVLERMKNEEIAVEICTSSNESILGVEGHDHPFELYRRAGVPITINTDDEGINRSNITMEYVKAVERYDLSYKDVKELVLNSIKYSFLPDKKKKEMMDRVSDSLVKFEQSLSNGFKY